MKSKVLAILMGVVLFLMVIYMLVGIVGEVALTIKRHTIMERQLEDRYEEKQDDSIPSGSRNHV